MVKIKSDWLQELHRALTGSTYGAEVVHTEYGRCGQILEGRNNLGVALLPQSGSDLLWFPQLLAVWGQHNSNREEGTPEEAGKSIYSFVYLERL